MLRSSSGSSQNEKMACISYESQVEGFCNMGLDSQKSLNDSDEWLISGQPGSSGSSLDPTRVSADPLFLKLRVESSQAGLCSGTSRNLKNVVHIRSDDSETEFGIEKRQHIPINTGITADSSDPFAFQEDDFEPSKWDLLSGSGKKSLSQDSKGTVSGYENGNHALLIASQQESSNKESCHSQATSCSSAVDEDKSNLLADCLLTAVKVVAYFF